MAHAKLSPNEYSDVQKLFSLINDRFQLQKEVAAYKFASNMPSFIPGREQQILADVRSITQAQHLDLQSVQLYIDVQLRTSVDLQNNWRKYWQKNSFPKNYPIKDLNGYIRPELSRLTHDIVVQIGQALPVLTESAYYDEMTALFDEIVDDEFITLKQKESILNALVRIKKA